LSRAENAEISPRRRRVRGSQDRRPGGRVTRHGEFV